MSDNNNGLKEFITVLTMRKLEVIDFLRGFAIFTIVLMHCVQGYLEGILSKAAALGGAGVHVFILCSGLGLYLSYLNKPLSYGDFLKKRFGKVYFPYIIVIGLFAVWGFYKSGAVDWKAVASHVLLYKMVDNELDVSICYPFWFISTIIQFYIFFPVIVKLIRISGGYLLALLISLLWASFVGWLGYEEYRPWGSFFLQYLWEFALGMWLAEKVKLSGWTEDRLMKKLKMWHLVMCMSVGMGLSAVMAWNGGFLKLYNDIPSLFGYASMLLLVYKVGMNHINTFFIYTSKIGYEWYLVHSLTFTVAHHFLDGLMPMWIVLTGCLLASYTIAFLYSKIPVG